MSTISHAYLAVGIAGLAAFVLLLLCGQHHSLASGQLGGTEVSVSIPVQPGTKSVSGRAVAPVTKDGLGGRRRIETGGGARIGAE